MKFFVPHLKETSDPEKVFESICRFAEMRMGTSVARKLRPFRIEYKRDEEPVSIQVGRDLQTGELITAIVCTSVSFLACTYRDGFLKGIPLIIDRDEAEHVEYFEEFTPHVARNTGNTY